MEELEAQHKKEIKTLEADKRTAMKKIKGTAGKSKKGKEILAAAELEWDEKYTTLLKRHEEERAALSIQQVGETAIHTSNNHEGDILEESKDATLDEDAVTRQKALEKKLRKKQVKLQKEQAREEEIARQMANAPNPRKMEIEAIMELYLKQEQMEIEEIKADGNCLYRAIARQLEILQLGDYDYVKVRIMCSDEMMRNREEYEPFADLHEMNVQSFDEYIEKVRSSNEWGGHLELRALAKVLNKVIKVYSTDSPLEIRGTDVDDDDRVITLSFHRNYYALGEHYNSVVKKLS